MCAQVTSPNGGRSTLGLSFGGDLITGDRPAALDGFVPSKDRFLQIAARKGVMVSNGYHGYYVDGPEWIDSSPEAEAVRALADNAKSPEQQQAEADQARQLEIKRMIDQLRNVDIEGFFPTPDAVIDMMLAAADMHDGQTVLEPSAGIGSICDRVKQAFPHTDLDAVELRDSLAKILVAKGHAVVGRDFTAWNGNGRQYDRVLMNPPFEKGADMAHVRQAFNHVKAGGRLVAIMSNGFRFRQTSRATGFRAWLEEMDGDVVELPDDAFNGSNAFRRTGVKAVMVAVQKPGWQEAAEQAANPASKAGHSSHPGRQASSESQAAQHAPQASPAASNGQQETSTPAPSVSASKTSVPTNPVGKQDSEPQAEPNATRTNSSGLQQSPEKDKERRNGNLLARHKPARLADIHGQSPVVRSLTAFAAAPHSNAFIFAGSSGVGKTAAAWALANELGCDPEWGGVVEIPSGTQDGRAVEDLLRRMHLRPMAGSGWKVVIINEADRMTPQAEVMWLDCLEKLPSKTVVVFTTNNLHRLTDRFVRRCEVQRFDATSDDFRDGMVDAVRQVWKRETGTDLDTIPQDLGKFELGSDEYSIGLALQQIAPYLRTGDPLPASFTVPIIREDRKPKLVASYGSTKVAEFAASRKGKRKLA